METIAVTIREIYQLCLVVYMLGMFTILIPYWFVRLFHFFLERRIRREQLKIHRRTPLGV